jgi:putative transposase
MYNRVYKFRIYPTKEQEMLLKKHFDACRFIYNYFLEQKIKVYKETRKTISWQKQSSYIPQLKQGNIWLEEVTASTLQQTILNLNKAYISFFRSGKGFPRFKTSKYSKKTFTYSNGKLISLDVIHKKITLPKFRYIKLKSKDNRIKCKFHREVEGKIKSATVSQDKDGKYYVSILTEMNKDFPNKHILSRDKAIGIDFGMKTFLTLSNGNKVDSPRYFEQSRLKLAKHQQDSEKLAKDSTAYKSKQEQITKLHSKIARQRKDFLDKLTYKLTHENQVDTICIEDLSIQKMQKNQNRFFNRKIGDLSWFEFTRLLQYKSDWYGKNFIKIGRFDPSSKTCNVCGVVNHELKLDDRTWKCSNCQTDHDRDINAAKNILDFAFTKMKFPKDKNYPIEA